MGKTIAEKIISAHLVEGTLTRGSEVAIRIDQTLPRVNVPSTKWAEMIFSAIVLPIIL